MNMDKLMYKIKHKIKHKRLNKNIATLATGLLLFGVSIMPAMATEGNNMTQQIQTKDFGTLDDGRKVTQYLLENKLGTQVSIINLGAVISELHTIDKKGNFADIVLGFDNPQQYLDDSPYFGAVVGRYGNRIANGKFSLDGKNYQLDTNNDKNHLHGGIVGFDKRLWQAKINQTKDDTQSLTLSLLSKDGDQGYPGTLTVSVTYTLTADNLLTIDYQATTDKTTVINLTQHSYFNLAGHNSGDILNHQLQLNAKQFIPTDRTAIPTGELAEVANTAFDFSQIKTIGRDINSDEQQLIFGKGYDHNWVLNPRNKPLSQAAMKVVEPRSGRTLTIYTDQPGVQFYSGNFLDGTIIGKNKAVYHHRNGFCLETQHFPDSPNQAHFPSTRLTPEETYTSSTIFSFGVQ